MKCSSILRTLKIHCRSRYKARKIIIQILYSIPELWSLIIDSQTFIVLCLIISCIYFTGFYRIFNASFSYNFLWRWNQVSLLNKKYNNLIMPFKCHNAFKKLWTWNQGVRIAHWWNQTKTKPSIVIVSIILS